jgi:hypothetical protein
MVGSPQNPRRVEIPQVQGVLVSEDFPLDRASLLARATEHGADESMRLVLERLPERTYETPAAVLDAVRDLDAEQRQGAERPQGQGSATYGGRGVP